jgi:hypothetical protein
MLVSQSASDYRQPDSLLLRIRQAIALPIYTVVLVLGIAYAVTFITLLMIAARGRRMTEWPVGADDL